MTNENETPYRTQFPTLGRIVLYTIGAEEAPINGARTFPAIVVRAWSDDCVNLRVLYDGHHIGWKTYVLPNFNGDHIGNFWEWPPRV